MTNTPQGAPAPDYGQNTPGQNTPGQPGSKYGTSAYDPQRSFELGKPAKVDTLHRMTLASLAIWIISSIVGVIMSMSPGFEEQLVQSYVDAGVGQDMAEEMAANAGIFGLISGIIMLVIALIPYILVLIGVPKGKNWARILGIVFAIIGALFGLYGVITGLGTLGDGILPIIGFLLNLAFTVVAVYWLVLAVNGKVAAWFKGDR